jgi:hypothetical protein
MYRVIQMREKIMERIDRKRKDKEKTKKSKGKS